MRQSWIPSTLIIDKDTEQRSGKETKWLRSQTLGLVRRFTAQNAFLVKTNVNQDKSRNWYSNVKFSRGKQDGNYTKIPEQGVNATWNIANNHLHWALETEAIV